MTINYGKKQISAVIFDMDRLLVDTMSVWEQPAKSLMADIGLHWTMEVSHHYRGMDARGVVETIFRLFKPEISIDECHKTYRSALLKAFAEQPIKALPGTGEILKFLHRKIPIAVASGSPAEGIEKVLTIMNWHNYFDIAVSSEEVGQGRGKPFPDVFLETSKKLNVPPHQCLVLEDALEGVKAALDAKMQCISVPSADPDKIRELGVETCASLNNVIDLLQP